MHAMSTVQCDRTGECFPSAHEAAACEAAGSSSQRPSRSCQVAGAEAGWRCGDGRCISALQVEYYNNIQYPTIFTTEV